MFGQASQDRGFANAHAATLFFNDTLFNKCLHGPVDCFARYVRHAGNDTLVRKVVHGNGLVAFTHTRVIAQHGINAFVGRGATEFRAVVNLFANHRAELLLNTSSNKRLVMKELKGCCLIQKPNSGLAYADHRGGPWFAVNKRNLPQVLARLNEINAYLFARLGVANNLKASCNKQDKRVALHASVEQEVTLGKILQPDLRADGQKFVAVKTLKKALPEQQVNGNHVTIITSFIAQVWSLCPMEISPVLFSRLRLLAGFLLVGLALHGGKPVWAAQPAPVATASMASGGVTRQPLGGKTQALRQGDKVYEGDLITTGSGAYVYLSTDDQAFLSIRPGSSLTIVNYQVDQQNPANNRIRIDLHKGVVRWVSGQGASAARDRFRLNTPVAAIGVRGTDFSVYAEPGLMRASVRSGRIAVSPFNEACLTAQLGPCGGDASLDLDSKTAPVIQVLEGQARPKLLQTLDLSPDRLVPPAPDEQPVKPQASQSQASTTAQASVTEPISPVTTAATTNAATTSNPANTTASAVVNRLTEQQLASQVVSTQTTITQQPSADRISWGRWRDLAGLPATQSLDAFNLGKERTHVVGPFMVARDQQSFNRRPDSGLFAFQLVDAQAVIVAGSGADQAVKAASVVNPSFKIDFGANEFYTEIGIRSPDGRVTALVAKGLVDKNGTFTSESRFSNGIVNGILAGPDATQAGYVFHRSTLGGAESAVGATRWAR